MTQEEDLDQLRQRAFVQLKPICVQIMNPATFTTVKRDDASSNPLVALQEAIATFGRAPKGSLILDGLFDFISFPLVQLLKYPSPSAVAVECALLCLLTLLQNCSNDYMPLALYREMLVALPHLIANGSIQMGSGGQGRRADDVGARLQPPPEELKMVGVRCVNEMLRRVTIPERGDLLEQNTIMDTSRGGVSSPPLETATEKHLDQPQYQHILAHLVVVLLEVIETARNVELQTLALSTLSDLALRIHNPDYVAQFLPAVSSTLVKVIVRDEKQSHKVFVGCLETLTVVVNLVMNDEACAHVMPKEAAQWGDLVAMAKKSEKQGLDTQCPPSPRPQQRDSTDTTGPPAVIRRDQNWHENAVLRLNRLFANSFTVRSHENWRVRRAFLLCTSSIIRACSRSLAPTVPLLIETLVGYVNDDYPEVATTCRTELRVIGEIIRGQQSLNSILKKNFYTMMMALPQHVMQPDDGKKLAALQTITGYLLLLKDAIRPSLSTVMSRVSIGLLRIWTFDTSNVKLVEDRTAGGDLATSLTTSIVPPNGTTHHNTTHQASSPGRQGDYQSETHMFPRKRYKYFHDDRVEKGLAQVCRLLGLYGNAAYLTDHFLGYMSSFSLGDFQAQAIKIINELCLGAAGVGVNVSWDDADVRIHAENERRCKNLVKSVAREYLRSPLWDKPTNIADVALQKDLQMTTGTEAMALHADENSGANNTKLSDFNAVILKACLLLEGFSIHAQILGADVQVLLMDALYLILEKVADPNYAVSQSAMTTLRLVAVACGYPKHPNQGLSRIHGAIIELTLDNIDYVVNVVSRRLRYISMNPKAPLVLKAAIRIAGNEILTYMDDSVDEITEALDQWHSVNERLVMDLVAVLEELVTAMSDDQKNSAVPPATASAASQPDDGVPGESSKGKTTGMETLEFTGCSKEMIEFYLEHGPTANNKTAGSFGADEPKKKTIREIEKYFTDRHSGVKDFEEDIDDSDLNIGNQSSQPPPPTADDPNSDPTKNPPPTPSTHSQSLALKILTKMYYFLSNPNPRLRVQCLRIITAALPLLNKEKDLDPTIHRFWPLVVRRLGDDPHFVVMAALDTVTTMCRIAPEFVNKRVADDLIPRFKTLAISVQHQTSRSSGRSADNKHSRTFTASQTKIQLSTLTTIANLITSSVPLSGTAVRTIVDATIPFLNSKWYDAQIVEAAVNVLSALKSGGAYDVVWLAVWNLLRAKRLPSPAGATSLKDRFMPAYTIQQATNRSDDVAEIVPAAIRVLTALYGSESALNVADDGWVRLTDPAAPMWVR
ncbi:hypothetical protein PhCBS80983_g03674 [Powellomyces hirtus]|uniref:Uncharacterized protein n=1 Tax=Powellomyces hirtus TaxID=109895 RepID=A0A507E1B3_9FUNG|nr:hypothetical protein PhCBS80983_g03674 [Powellomyces hirtus]